MMESNEEKIIVLSNVVGQVRIPKQKIDIDVKIEPLPDILKTPPEPKVFQPFRLVINMKLVEAEHPEMEVKVFDPPIEIQIQYTAEDLRIAKAAGRELLLGFWDGTHWEVFTEEKHNFKLVPAESPDDGGYGIVQISKWDDPTKAWGT